MRYVKITNKRMIVGGMDFMNIALHGHASTSVYTMTVNGTYREVMAPNGATFLALAMVPKTEDTAEVSDTTILSSILADMEKYRREYYGMHLYTEAGTNRQYHAISRYLGSRSEENSLNILTMKPPHPDEPYDLIVFDDGSGGLDIDQYEPRHVMWMSHKALPERTQIERLADRCFLFLDADVLRNNGAMISRQISWERTLCELVRALSHNTNLAYLSAFKHVLLTFAEDGAVFINREHAEPTVHLILTHGGLEGVLRENKKGDYDNTFISMGMMMTHRFMGGALKNPDAAVFRSILETGESNVMSGYDFGDGDGSLSIGANYGSPKNWPAFKVPIQYDKDNGVMSLEDGWTIADSVNNAALSDVAYEYVRNGDAVIDGLPKLKFGAFTSIDRWEIESYQNIRNLMMGYAASNQTKPLSIAVFGSPGSGKSFGVTQIAQNIMPGKIEKLEFNVSQFTSLHDLAYAFQSVRDTILTGKLPLVFFDEFDSDRDGISLGWIKSFLMPMQDGRFKDDSGEHPLGRCILVFAGGTASSFEAFNRMNDSDFKAVKGPDFVSRLRGTINVLGPNPRNAQDKNYILRRALLLRSLCARKLTFDGEIAPVANSIIHAMLHVPMYLHGARSMEAILDMSLINNNTWEPVSLPAHSQLALHVDADAFIKLVLAE